MAERPILFSGPMVQAILVGRKTQTRRVANVLIRNDLTKPPCPYGKAGDTLWVRETWQYANWTEDGYPYVGYRSDGAKLLREHYPEEWAERIEDIWADLSRDENFNIDGRAADRRWRPAIHMPRWASRITLRVTSVRKERLQDISRGDCMAEGCPFPNMADGPSPRDWFAALWDSINAKRGYAWTTNPWVWAVEFEQRHKENRDAS